MASYLAGTAKGSPLTCEGVDDTGWRPPAGEFKAKPKRTQKNRTDVYTDLIGGVSCLSLTQHAQKPSVHKTIN